MPHNPHGWRDLVADGRGPILLLIGLGVWLMAADSLVTATIMPDVGADLGAFEWFGWATSAFLVAGVVASASAGWLSLRIGLRNAMALTGVLLAAGCVTSATGGIGAFLAGRTIQGLASGWVLGLCYVTISSMFPARHLPRVFAMTTSVWGSATFVGPLIGGIFANAGNWRGVFWLFAAQAVLFALATLWLVPRRSEDAGEARGVPARQLLLLAAGVTALAFAGVVSGTVFPVALCTAGVALLALTLIDDRKASVPLLPRSAGKLSTPIGMAYAVYFATTGAATAFAVYAPAMLQFSAGLSPLGAGYFVAIEAITWTVCSLSVSGAQSPWNNRFIILGALSITTGAVMLTFLMASGHLVAIAVAAALLGGGFGLSYSFISQRVITGLSEEERELGSGGIGAVRSAGGAVGAAIAGIAANLAGFSGGLTAANVWPSALAIFGVGVPFAVAALWAAVKLAYTPVAPAAAVTPA